MEKKRKKWLPALIVVGVILLLFVVFITVAVCKFNKKWHPGEKTEFESLEEFESYIRGEINDIPEGATDLKFYYNYNFVSCVSMYSFVIEDEAEYEAYMEAYSDEYFGEKIEHSITPFWESYGDSDSYTEEELEEMAYLEEYYYELDYKEILSMSRHKFGFFNGYGAKVGDYTNMSYSLAEIPINNPGFKHLEEGSLVDYTILYYYPQNVGASTSGVIVDEENRKFIIYGFSYIK